MSETDKMKFDRQNSEIITAFLKTAAECKDDISSSILATISQFLMNFRRSIMLKAKNSKYVLPEQIIESQIEELRRCIVDLDTCKARLPKEEMKQ